MSMDRNSHHRARGFAQAGSLLSKRIRTASEGRGFAVSRLLTHWQEVAGPEIAQSTRPVRITYGKGGLGATLTLLVRGASAPFIQAELPKLRDRVNAVYGYAAVSRISLTQTAPTGFAEGQADFDHKPSVSLPAEPSGDAIARSQEAVRGIDDPDLKAALSRMGAHIMTTQD